MAKRKQRKLISIPWTNPPFSARRDCNPTSNNIKVNASTVTLVDANDWEILLSIFEKWIPPPSPSSSSSSSSSSSTFQQQPELVDDVLRAIQIVKTGSTEHRIVGVEMPSFLLKVAENSHCNCAGPNPAGTESLFSSWEGLDAVQRLSLGGKFSNSEIPFLLRGVGQLPHLVELTLSFDNAVEFPCDIFTKRNTALKSIDLTGCPHLNSIPNSIGLLGPTLERLSVGLHHLVAAATWSMASMLPTSVVEGDDGDFCEVAERFLPQSMKELVHLKHVDFVGANNDTSVLSSASSAILQFHLSSIVSCWQNLESIQLGMNELILLISQEAPIGDGRSIHHNYYYWPKLKDATVIISLASDSTSVGVPSMLERVATHWKDLQSLTMLVVPSSPSHESRIANPLFVPLTALHPLGRSIERIDIRCVERKDTKMVLWNPMGIAIQDIGRLSSLKSLTLHNCRFVGSPPPPSTVHGMDCAQRSEMNVDDTTSTTTTSATPAAPPTLETIELHGCSQFFRRVGGDTACSYIANHVDLSSLRCFRLTKAGPELGDSELETLCTTLFRRCPKVEEIDLSDGNICHLDGTDADTDDVGTTSVLTCLPPNTLRVLEFSRNPAVCPKFEDDSAGPKTTAATMNRNIEVLWYLVARYPYLGYVGRYNVLFLGRLGEHYERLLEYYRLVHELCLNRARFRLVRARPVVPRGLWPHILEKAVRAYDDYPNHVLARNRKDPPDAIYHLLRERGAVDLFF